MLTWKTFMRVTDVIATSRPVNRVCAAQLAEPDCDL